MRLFHRIRDKSCSKFTGSNFVNRMKIKLLRQNICGSEGEHRHDPLHILIGLKSQRKNREYSTVHSECLRWRFLVYFIVAGVPYRYINKKKKRI